MSKIRVFALLAALLGALAAHGSATLFGLRNPGDAGRQLVSLDGTTAAITEISASIDPPNATSSGVVFTRWPAPPRCTVRSSKAEAVCRPMQPSAG